MLPVNVLQVQACAADAQGTYVPVLKGQWARICNITMCCDMQLRLASWASSWYWGVHMLIYGVERLNV